VASPFTRASRPLSSLAMNHDTPQSIARELVDAVDAFGITGDPPRVDELSHRLFIAAIKKIDGPNVDAEARLCQMLNALVTMANALRKRQ
jgi:hypothetical protein